MGKKMNEKEIRKESIEKQKQVRMAAREDSVGYAQEILSSKCAYCIEYRKMDCVYCGCQNCPIYKKHNMPCYGLREWNLMLRSDISKEEFLIYHKCWCLKLGLWQEGWK